MRLQSDLEIQQFHQYSFAQYQLQFALGLDQIQSDHLVRIVTLKAQQ